MVESRVQTGQERVSVQCSTSPLTRATAGDIPLVSIEIESGANVAMTRHDEVVMRPSSLREFQGANVIREQRTQDPPRVIIEPPLRFSPGEVIRKGNRQEPAVLEAMLDDECNYVHGDSVRRLSLRRGEFRTGVV